MRKFKDKKKIERKNSRIKETYQAQKIGITEVFGLKERSTFFFASTDDA